MCMALFQENLVYKTRWQATGGPQVVTCWALSWAVGFLRGTRWVEEEEIKYQILLGISADNLVITIIDWGVKGTHQHAVLGLGIGEMSWILTTMSFVPVRGRTVSDEQYWGQEEPLGCRAQEPLLTGRLTTAFTEKLPSNCTCETSMIQVGDNQVEKTQHKGTGK